MALQLTRFEKPLAILRTFLTPEKLAPERLDATLDEFVKRDARGALFKLEGLLRIYDGIVGEPLHQLLAEAKGIEDLVGAYTEKLEYLEFARAVEADPRAIHHIEEEAKAARELVRSGLPTVPPALDRIEWGLRQVQWESDEDDVRSVIEEIARELGRTARLDYDMDDLQAGVHELRRKLRWILIYVQALDGMIVLEKKRGPFKLNVYSYLETHPIAQSPFSKVEPNPAVTSPARFPTLYFLALSKVVNELGEVKSMGENAEALAHALQGSGVASDPHAAHVQALAAGARHARFVRDVPEAAKRIKRELKETKLLSRIRKSLLESVGEDAGD